MDSQTIRNIFNKFFNNMPNMFTPNRVEFGSMKNHQYVYEVSSGKDMAHETVYAITVLKKGDDGWERTTGIDTTGFRCAADAVEYLREKLEEIDILEGA